MIFFFVQRLLTCKAEWVGYQAELELVISVKQGQAVPLIDISLKNYFQVLSRAKLTLISLKEMLLHSIFLQFS